MSNDWSGNPSGWYYGGRFARLSATPIKVTVCDLELVVYLGGDGQPYAMPSRCPHMNVPMWLAKRKGNGLVCPMHGKWIQPSGCGVEHGFLVRRVQDYFFISVTIHQNHIPVFPRFSDVPLSEIRLGPPLQVDVDVPWYMIVANGFDVRHFSHVHGREILRSSPVLSHGRDGIEITHHFRNVGHLWSDRLLRFFAGDRIQLHYPVINGNTILPKSQIGDRVNRMWIDVQRIDAGRSRVTLFPVVMRPSRFQILYTPAMLLRRWMIRSFFKAELPYIEHMRFDTSRAEFGDETLVECLNWLLRQCHSGTEPTRPQVSKIASVVDQI